LRFSGDNIYLFIFTGFEIVVVITSIKVEFWFPCFKIVFPGVNINARVASNNANNVGFDVLGNNEGGGVRKRSSDEENVDLHYDYDNFKGPAFRLICV
jgi:hypothetical protein